MSLTIESTATTPIRILHLEDSPVDAELIGECLGETGLPCQVTRVDTRAEFVREIETRRFDLILSDFALPSFDGGSALAIAHELAPETPFIFVSGILGEDIAVDSLKRGATDYVLKHRLQRLPAAVTRAIDEARRRTEHRATEEALRRQIELTHTIAENAAAALFLLDTAGRVTYMNPAAEETFGFTRAQLAGQVLHDALHRHPPEASGPPSGNCPIERAFQSQHTLRDHEDVFYRRDGSPVPVSCSNTPILKEEMTEGAVLVVHDITERKAIERRQTLLMAEVDHRAKNMLALVQALVRLTRADSIEAFTKAIEGRIAALARAHTLLSQSRWEGADLRRLIGDELAPYNTSALLDGPAVCLLPAAAQALGMVFHELATNAVKHGALSTPKGCVQVSWTVSKQDSSLNLVWTERSGPPVAAPLKRGVGTKVILQSVTHQLSGAIDTEWDVEGLRVTLRIPASQLLQPSQGSGLHPDQVGRETRDGRSLAGQRILVVEDMGIQALELRQLVTDLGCQIVGPAANVQEALALAQSEPLDAAILDIDLRGEKSYVIADILAAQGIPYVFSTGYGREAGLDGRFVNAQVVRKPFDREELVAALLAVVAPSSAA